MRSGTSTRGRLRGRRAARVTILYSTVTQDRHVSQKVRLAEDLSANADAIREALLQCGDAVHCQAFDSDVQTVLSELRLAKPDVVFNLAEAPGDSYGKEPHVAALLELLGLAYTGNGPLALALCKDKARTKTLLRAHGIPTPPFCVFTQVPTRKPPLSFPLVVKPVCQDGSQGITDASVVENLSQLKAAVEHLLRHEGQNALAEEFLGGREFNVSVIGNGSKAAPYRVLPPGEFVYHSPQWRVCTFDAKWDEQHPSYAAVEAVCPASIPSPLRRRLEEMTVACARIFELQGYSRLDYRLDQEGQPHLFDVNPNPDLAPRMGIARAAEAAGLSYPEFLGELVRLGLEKGVV